jgi:hypothetical protein
MIHAKTWLTPCLVVLLHIVGALLAALNGSLSPYEILHHLTFIRGKQFCCIILKFGIRGDENQSFNRVVGRREAFLPHKTFPYQHPERCLFECWKQFGDCPL